MPKNDEATEVDLSKYLEKEATDLQSRMADWLLDDEIVGYDPSKAKTKEEAFREGVRLAVAMRMIFQASPENQEVLLKRRAEREEAEATPKEKPTKKPAASEKPKGKKASAETTEEPAPASKGKKGKKTAAPAEETAPAKKPVKKRKPANDEDEAPF